MKPLHKFTSTSTITTGKSDDDYSCETTWVKKKVVPKFAIQSVNYRQNHSTLPVLS